MKFKIIAYTPVGEFTSDSTEIKAETAEQAATVLTHDGFGSKDDTFLLNAQSGGVIAVSKDMLKQSVLIIQKA